MTQSIENLKSNQITLKCKLWTLFFNSLKEAEKRQYEKIVHPDKYYGNDKQKNWLSKKNNLGYTHKEVITSWFGFVLGIPLLIIMAIGFLWCMISLFPH